VNLVKQIQREELGRKKLKGKRKLEILICRVCKRSLTSSEHIDNAAFCFMILQNSLDDLSQAHKFFPELQIIWNPKGDKKHG